MPLISTLGAASSRGFGEFAQQASGLFVEDVFSTFLYTGNNTERNIVNDIAFVGTSAWNALRVKDVNNYTLEDVKVDSSGNLYTAGTGYDGTKEYASLTKYDSTGTVLWKKRLEQGGTAFGGGVAFDSSGNVYFTGYYNDGSGFVSIIAKYDSSGTLSWQRKLAIANGAFGNRITVAPSGNIYCAGTFYNSLFVAKYNSSGTIQWQRTITQNTGGGYGVAIDSSENVFVAGYANDATREYSVIAKYNDSGTIQWQRKYYGPISSSRARDIAIDSSGNVYVAGNTDSGISVLKYNTSGSLQWQRRLVLNDSRSNGITIDSSDNVYISGRFTTDAGRVCVLVAKYNSSGTLQWQRSLTYSSNSYGMGIAVTSSGSLYVATNYTDGSYSSGALVKLAADGSTAAGVAMSGSTTLYELAVSYVTASTPAYTETSGSATTATGTATESAGTATNANSALTTTLFTQAAIISDGGMVWMKERNGASQSDNNAVYDTNRLSGYVLSPNQTSAEAVTGVTAGLTGFRYNGFSVGTAYSSDNRSGRWLVSWSFKKAKRFFDVVTYTGNGSFSQTINHNLGITPGMVIVKLRSNTSTYGWHVYHRSNTTQQALLLNTTGAAISDGGWWANTAPTATAFTVGDRANVNGATYVAYLFAHDTAADGIIQCGSFTAGSNTVTLGWEPQYVLIKRSDSTSDWLIFDTMRGLPAFPGTSDRYLYTNSAAAEQSGNGILNISSTGFTGYVGSSGTWVYMAIRRGPMRVPTDATKVFNTATGTHVSLGTITRADMVYYKGLNDYGQTAGEISDRLRGFGPFDNWTIAARASSQVLVPSSSGVEVSGNASTGTEPLDTNVFGNKNAPVTIAYGSPVNTSASGSNYSFVRAPSFFDVVCYVGTGAIRTVNHNLGVVPELIIVKNRSSSGNWITYSAATGNANYMLFDTTLQSSSSATIWNSTSPTATQFTVGSQTNVNGSGSNLVAYLFASCPGVSKVGSYTGTGTTQQINCGFTAGARFILIKRTDSAGDWYVYDSARGIVAGDDPYFFVNAAAVQVTNTDYVDTHAAGFELSSTAPAGLNANGGTYIFLAIA